MKEERKVGGNDGRSMEDAPGEIGASTDHDTQIDPYLVAILISMAQALSKNRNGGQTEDDGGSHSAEMVGCPWSS